MQVQSGSGSKDIKITINGQALDLQSTNCPVIARRPDLLRYEQIGEADNLRGRVVRAFFWLMRAWPT